MTVVMAPIDSTGQNAENAHFEKRAILVEFSSQKIKKLPLCRNFFFLSFCTFPLTFFVSKIRASINAPKMDFSQLSENNESVLRQSLSTAAGSALHSKKQIWFFSDFFFETVF